MDLLTSNREDLAQLLALHADNDLGGLIDLVHRIKGGARIIKARWLLQACESFEQAFQDSRPGLALDPLVDNLHQAMAALADRLERFCEG